MDSTELTYAIFEDWGLRHRIEALVRSHWWNDSAAIPNAVIPVDDLAWAAASNVSIRNTVSGAGGVGDLVSDAVKAIPDGDLEYVVLNALPRLGL